MEYQRGRYSKYIRPALIVFDLFVINFLAIRLLDFNEGNLHFFSSSFLNNKHILFLVYSVLLWGISTFLLKFYNVYRFTSALNVVSLLVKQFFVFSIIVFAFEGIFRSINIQAQVTFYYLVYVFILIGFVKLMSFYILIDI